MTNQQNVQEMLVKEKAPNEVEEKRRRLWVVWFGGVLIMLGLAFAANNLGIMPVVSGPNEWDKVEWTDWVILGGGLWGLVINLFRVYSPAWPNPHLVDWLLSGILAAIGVSLVVNLSSDVGELIGAVGLVGLGVVLLFNAMRQKEPV